MGNPRIICSDFAKQNNIFGCDLANVRVVFGMQRDAIHLLTSSMPLATMDVGGTQSGTCIRIALSLAIPVLQ